MAEVVVRTDGVSLLDSLQDTHFPPFFSALKEVCIKLLCIWMAAQAGNLG